MREKTPGQAAYEHRTAATASRFPARPVIAWERLSPAERADEEAAAQAASAYYEDVASELRAELIDVRVLVAEILDHYAPKGTTTTTMDLSWNAHFRQRAGLDTAVATARTDHIAAELAERDAFLADAATLDSDLAEG